MRKLYALCTLLFAFTISTSAQQGATCASALVINNLPYNTPFLQNHNTCGAGNNYNSSHRCGNNYFMGQEEFMFRYTPANDICVNMTVSASNLNDVAPAIFITKDCPDDVNGQCVAQYVNPTPTANVPNPATLNQIELKGGNTYYIQVTARTECFAFTFNMERSALACAAKPKGYDCDNADEITSLPYDTSGFSNCNRTNILREGNECASSIYYDGPAYIWKYKPNRDMCVRFVGQTESSTMRFSIHDTCPTYSDTTCVSSYYFYTFGERTYYESLDSGKTYYFVMSSGATCTAMDFTFSEIPNTGSVCSNAWEIDTNATGYYENLGLTTRCMGDDIKEEWKCLSSDRYDDGNEVFFKYESAGNECISAAAFNVSGSYLSLSMFKDCPGSGNDSIYAYDCSTYSFPQYNPASIEYTITDPGTYYFVVSGYSYQFSPTSTKFTYDRDFDFRFSSQPFSDIGRDCSTADNLSSTTYVYKPGLAVQCKGNDYSDADACDNPLINGSDYVMTYTAPKDFCGTIMGKNVKGTGGLMLFDDCPNPNVNCLAAAGCEVGCDSIYMDWKFKQGETYYIVAAASSGNFFEFDIEIKKRLNTPDGCPETNQGPCQDKCEECENADFELGSFRYWDGFTGRYNTPKQTPGLDTSYINDPLSRHTLMNAGGYDPVVGDNLLSTTGPLSKRYATRIGNRNSGYEADVLTYAFTVTPETRNFFYYYAVVFNDPDHPANEQPFFGVTMTATDENGVTTEIGCAEYEVRANPDDPTFVETYDHVRNSTSVVIRWKDWTLVTVPLDDYMGQDVVIEFTTKDCDRGGHYGYAYIDAFCGDIEIESNTGKYAICPGNQLKLEAPEGFASYQWSTGATTREINVNAAGTYTVVLTPFSQDPLLNCAVTLSQEVTVSDQPLADFTFDEGCIDQFIDFTDASAGSANFPIEEWSWNFGEGTGWYPDTNRIHTFPGPGIYDVTLAVMNTGGCRDTVVQQVEIPEFPSLDPVNALDTIKLCQFEVAQLEADDLGNVSYNWSGPSGFSSNAQRPTVSLSSIQTEGEYVIEVISNDDPCLTTYDTTFIDVVLMPDYRISQDASRCFSNPDMKLFASGGQRYEWSPADIFDNPNSQTPTASPDSTTVITVNTFHDFCPDSTMEMTLTIDWYEELVELVDTITLCEGDSIIIEPIAGQPREWMRWQTPDGIFINDSIVERANAVDSLGGYYFLWAYLGTAQYCEYAYDSVYVNVVPAPIANLSPDTALNCVGEEVSFEALNPMPDIYWTNEDGDTVSTTNALTTVVDDTWYYAYFANETGCTSKDSVFADEFEMVKPDLGEDKVYCIGDNYKTRLQNGNQVPDDYNFLWNTGETTERITVDTTGAYILTAEKNGCFSYDTILVTFQDPANFSLGNDTLLCQGDSLHFDLSAFGEEIRWNDGDENFERTIYFPGGTYSVDIESGACVLEDEITINFEPLIPAKLPNDTAICFGEVLTVQGEPQGQDFDWFDNGTYVHSDPSITITEAGNHNLILNTSTSVCNSSDTMLVSVLSPAALNFPDQHICETDSVQINATIPFAGASYTWGDGYQGATRWISAAGEYTITIVAGPCVIEDTLQLTHDVVPFIDLGADQTICEDDNVTITPDVSTWPSYLWSDGTNTASNTLNLPGDYILTATNGLCSYSDTVAIFNDTIPVFDLGPDFGICETDQAVIRTGITNPAISFLWNDGSVADTLQTNQAGNYSVTATNGLCTYTDDLDLSVQALPGVDLGVDQVLCLGDQTTIGFTVNNATYLWSTGATTDSITVNTTDEYWLEVSQGLCVESDTIQVNFDVLTKPDLGSDILQCDNISATLDAKSVAQTYEWRRNGALLPQSSRSININQDGTYIVRAIQGTCEDFDTLNAVIQVSPSLSLSPDSILCAGESYRIEATTNSQNPNFTWNTGETTKDIVVRQTGNYTVTLVDGVCTVSETADIVFVPHPYIDLAPGDRICENETRTIGQFFNTNDTNQVIYIWNTGQNTGQITVDSTGRYVQRVNVEHCFDTDYFDLEVVDAPVPNMSNPVVTCADNIQPISTGLPGLQTSWSNGAGFGHIAYPRTSGEYIATITDGPCTVQGSVMVTVNPMPEEIVGDVYLCPVDSVQMDTVAMKVVQSGSQFLIEDGTRSPFVAYPGDHVKIEFTNQYGCKEVQTVGIIENPNCKDDIFIPNSFSPDGDNVNETFRIVMSEHITFKSFEVYDRWGHIVYKVNNVYKPWDGRAFGGSEEVQNGVYVYRIKYIDQYDMPQTKMGNITVFK